MAASFDRRRAIKLGACACVALIGALSLPARAQNARTSGAQGVAREWLKLVDENDAQASWAAAAPQFQRRMNVAAWQSALQQARVPLGAVVRRTIVATDFAKTFPGAPEGDYALVQFESAFAKKSQAHETLTLELEPDRSWRVLGYLIR